MRQRPLPPLPLPPGLGAASLTPISCCQLPAFLLLITRSLPHTTPPMQFHGADVTGLQFTADGAELVSVSMDASVCVWDAATGVLSKLRLY